MELKLIYSFGDSLYRNIRLPNTELALDGSLIMHHNSKLSIPVSGLVQDKEYALSINSSNIDGNGKVKFTITSNNEICYSSDLIVPRTSTELFLKFKINKVDNLFFNFEREKYIALGRTVIGKMNLFTVGDHEKVIVKDNLNKSINVDSNDDYIKHNTKRSSILNIETFKSNTTNIDKSFYLNSFESKKWFSIVKTSLPNTSYNTIGNCFNGLNKTNKTDIVLTSINDYFYNDFCYLFMFNKTNLELKKNSKIFTPSIKNKLYIENFTNNVYLSTLGLPPIDDIYENKEHFFYIEYDKDSTNKLLNSWNRNETLYIYGSDFITSKDNIINIPYYFDYNFVFDKFITSKCLLYFTEIDDCHKSDWIDLALLNNKTCITNNSYYINDLNFVNINNIKYTNNYKDTKYNFAISYDDFNNKILGIFND